MKSWRTTILGILSGILLVAGEVRDGLDDDPSTVFELDILMGGLAVAGLGVQARDNKVSSESVGAK